MSRIRFTLLAFLCCLLPFSEVFAQWTTYAPMPGTRWAHVCAGAGGKLYVAGGSTAPTWEYDPGANSWTVRASIPTVRSYAGIASWGGMIYVLGGSVGAAWSNKNERFDPATNTWTTLANMPQVRTTTAAAAVNGKIYVLNGWNGTAMTAVDIYDIATNTWSTGTPAPTGRSHAKTAIVNNRIYLVGGYAGGWVGTNEMYDPATNSWQTLAPMPTARYIHAIGEVGPKVYAAGGYSGSATNVVESYDVGSNSWSTETPMPTARYRTDGGSVNNCFFVLGGYNGSNLSVNEGICPVILPIPVELRAQLQTQSVMLEWEDADAEHMALYAIERSGENGNFEEIGLVPAENRAVQPWRFPDTRPLMGLNRYRLRRVDRNGDIGYSAAVEVNFQTAESFLLSWEPESEHLRLTWDATQFKSALDISVVDAAGRQMARFHPKADAPSATHVELHLPNLSTGIYFVRIAAGNGHWVKRVWMGN